MRPVSPPPPAHRHAGPPRDRSLARWLLQPPQHSPPDVVARGHELVELAARAGGQRGEAYDLETMRRHAGKLPGPVGRYAARLSVLGVRGVLSRCEVSTAHTFLVFIADGGIISRVEGSKPLFA